MTKPSAAGFTLIEMLVSLALFALVMLMVSSAYLIIIAANRQAQAVASATNNLAFALETMTREIRTGGGYNCGSSTGGDCPSPKPSFYFTDAGDNYVSYGLVSTGSGTHGLAECVSQSDFCAPATLLTDSSVNITALQFSVQGTRTYSGSGDIIQPQVLMTLSGTVSAGAQKTVPFTVETGATMRGTDL
ncbi:MAG TPA: prepilin-type N-terminal cleavage/methylation domain-containing protein [Candidatus Paceibacterota bacterium]|nr:prepilin-type N-terminal cleavage/methylation domain-containing protein [Candidatus Paceibacterota bacterium]